MILPSSTMQQYIHKRQNIGVFTFVALKQPSILQVNGHVSSIERDQNSRYFLQVSIFLNETPMSTISSIWYRCRPTLTIVCCFSRDLVVQLLVILISFSPSVSNVNNVFVSTLYRCLLLYCVLQSLYLYPE